MKITAELIREIVGARPKTRPLIDQLVEPLNLVLPAYGITTEYRLSAFLATAAPESDWFRTLREYGKGKGRAYGKPHRITGLIYYGRGIFQNTWHKGYKAFTEYVEANWSVISQRAAQYNYTSSPDFVSDPELLATPYWAVEAACWYWKANGLAKYADRGIKGFFGLQGLVNRGDAEKQALHYDARLRAYESARRVLPDDFILNSAATSANPSTETAVTASPVTDITNAATQPPINSNETKVIDAPAKEGSTATVTKTAIFGVTVPAVIVTAIEGMKSLIADGYLSASEIGTTVVGLIKDNYKFVFTLLIAFIGFILVKKAFKQITLWLQMWIASDPKRYDVEVQPK